MARGDEPRPTPQGYGRAVLWLGLAVPPDVHRGWIELRAAAQVEAGLIEEAAGLRRRYDPTLPAFSAIGYQEAWAVLDGRLSVDEAIALDARRNVRFARRQRTWFRREPDIEWLDARDDPLPRAVGRIRAFLDC